jgi:hypothetical protein
MIDEILKKRKNVKEYDSNAIITKDQIDSLLYRTWKITPSKNNFMPYTIHVLGPEQQEFKNDLYRICLSNEGRADGVNAESRYTKSLPQYSNIINCSYALIFAMRFEDQPNEYQKDALQRGKCFEAMDPTNPSRLISTVRIEIGMFADAFSALCLENNIDVSFTLCFQRELKYWQSLPFVKTEPLLIMTAGKGKTYSHDLDVKRNRFHLNLRPEYERIVNFI